MKLFLQTGNYKHLHHRIPQDPQHNCLYLINIPSLIKFYLLITLPNTCSFHSWKNRGMRTTVTYNEDIGDVEFEGDSCDGGFTDHLLRLINKFLCDVHHCKDNQIYQ